MRRILVTALVCALVGGASGAQAWQGQNWPVVAFARDADCALEITGNGQLFLISATGLGAGGPARYRVGNGDMTPIEWSVRAGSDGRFARYYLPFRANRDGGTVDVSVDAPDCAVSAAFEWRRGIRVID